MNTPDTGQAILVAITLFTLVIARWLVFRREQTATKATRQDQQPLKDGNTFRVRGVPPHWDAEVLRSFLKEHHQSTDPIVKSLALELHGRSRTGTVMFRTAASPPKTRILLPKPNGNQLTPDEYLTLDDDFHGITTLFMPPPEDHKVDIIAISGLGGHAFGSFKERGGPYMWLRDDLPYYLTHEDTNRSMARVMTYGYESTVAQSKNVQNLEDLATSFHHSLLPLISVRSVKPVVLVAHSLGGLIVKQTMITLSKSKKDDDLKLLRAVYGIVFFGVPHEGMDISSLIPMVGAGPNAALIHSIDRINSHILSIQQREFHLALGEKGYCEIVCFYETLESPTAQLKDGKWEMKGPSTILVTKFSATNCRPWEDGAEHICAVARTHSNMVKFGPQDHEYDKVREKLSGLGRRALTIRRRIQASETKFLVPYNQNPNFVERAGILGGLKQQLGFGQGRETPGSRVALYGLGGVGKTQIALAYVHWLQEECPEVSVFWVHASSAERFRRDYASIAQECRIPGHEDPKAEPLSLVMTWLRSKDRGRWLMVIDNADDAELFGRPGNLGQWVPECAHGSVLVTTRNKVAGSRLTRVGCLIEVGEMNEIESEQLLRDKLKTDDPDPNDLSRLASRLERLPLALAQAAAFIQEQSVSVTEYLRLLEMSDQNLVSLLSETFEAVGRDSGTPHAVVETWILSFEQIQRQDTFASELLSLMSLFDRQAIPKRFLSRYGERQKPQESTGEIQLVKALGVLKAFSFITEDKCHGFDMHRLVQLVTRKWLGKKDTMRQFAEQAMLVVSDIYPQGSYTTRDTCLALLPHAYAVLVCEGTGSRDERLARASLLGAVAGLFDYQGHWEEAERFLIHVAGVRRELLGTEHPHTLASLQQLTLVYQGLGRWREAEELGVLVMEARKRVSGEEHPHTRASMAALMSTYLHQARWKEAEELGLQILDAKGGSLGEVHPDILTSIANLASVYRNQERWKEAEELGLQVIAATKRVLGEKHPHTLTEMSNLATTYGMQGRWKEAEELGLQVIDSTKSVLGEEHPDTLSAISNLGSIYWKQGRLEDAEWIQITEFNISSRVLGEAHPSTLLTMSNLAFTWRSQGRLDEAIDLMLRCVKLHQQVLGPDHYDTECNSVALREWEAENGRSREETVGISE